MTNYKYSEEDMARMCEVAVILSGFNTECGDLHDFYSEHVKPLFNAWLFNNGEGVYKAKDEDEKAYITEFANRVAQELYERNPV